MFWDLNQDRQDGPNGPQPLGSTLIKAWCELSDTHLLPEEVKILRAMDQAWSTTFSKEMASAWKPKTKG